MVLLGLIGDNDLGDGICEPYDDLGDGAQGAPRLREFITMFGPRGIVGSVCAPDYAPFFTSAVDVVDTTCDEYIPPAD